MRKIASVCMILGLALLLYPALIQQAENSKQLLLLRGLEAAEATAAKTAGDGAGELAGRATGDAAAGAASDVASELAGGAAGGAAARAFGETASHVAGELAGRAAGDAAAGAASDVAGELVAGIAGDGANNGSGNGTNGEIIRDFAQYGTVSSTAEGAPDPQQHSAAASAAASKTSAASKPKAIGILIIDAIDLKLPYVEGVSDENLKLAPGHIPGTALPGQIGNAVIAGHRSYSYGRMFNRLEQLEPGSAITIKTGGKQYDYTVYEKKMVEPTDLSVLNHNGKDQIVTLITCDEEGKQRLILHAVLK